MRITDIKTVLKYMFAANLTPNIIGEHGKGKSQIIEQFAKENGYDAVVNIRLGQIQDVGDLVGLPEFIEVNGQKRTKFITPSMFPLEEDAKVIIFLDEYNRCPPQTLQAVFQLIEVDGRLGEYQVPKNSKVILASNPPTDEYTVTDMQDKALNDRFVPIKFTPTRDEWFQYMEGKGADETITSFLRDHSTALEVDGEDFSISDLVSPSRRSWDAVNRLLKTNIQENVDNGVFLELLGGLISPEYAVAYGKFTETFDKRVSADDVLNKYATVKKKLDFERVDVLNTVLDEIKSLIRTDVKTFTPRRNTNMFKFLADIPKDLSVAFFQQLQEMKETVDGEERSIILNEDVQKIIFNLNDCDAKLVDFVTKNFKGVLRQALEESKDEE